MKAAQLLAHIPEALPKEYAEELRSYKVTLRRWGGALSSAE